MQQLKELQSEFENAEPMAEMTVMYGDKKYKAVKGDENNSNILNLYNEDGEHEGYIDFSRQLIKIFTESFFEALGKAIIRLFKKDQNN